MVISQKMVTLPGDIKHKTPMVSFVGNSGSGKTTLLEKVVRELKGRGYRVAVIKHSPHGFELDIAGKDTWRFAAAGCDIVAISSPDKFAFFEQLDTELSPGQIETLIKGKVDIILTEGYKNSETAKILVLRHEGEWRELYCEKEILATVITHQTSPGIPQFDEADIISIDDLLIESTGKFSPHNGGHGSHAATLTMPYDLPQSDRFEKLLADSAALHGHICPGQVLGVRMAMRGLQELGIEKIEANSKRLVVYVEIDRCATDAIQVVTGCKLGKRTMKYVDYGKLAATFIDLNTGDAVRLAAREDVREKAARHQPDGWTKNEAQVAAYKTMPDEELFDIERVSVHIPGTDMPGPPLSRVICDECGEGVNDGREVRREGKILCRACANGSYYQPLILNNLAR